MNEILQSLLPLRAHLSVVHHVPGRLRLRLGSGILALSGSADPKRFAALLEKVEGIRNVRINPAAASVVVQYDAQRLPPELWQTLLEGSDTEVAALLQALIAATS